MRADPGEPEGAAPVDPFADLLFTLIAAVLPAILVLLPAMHMSTAAPRDRKPAVAPATAGVTVRGHAAAPIVAQADGLRLTGAGDRTVPLAAVPDDPGLRDLLRRLRDAGDPLLVVIEPGGLESAFLLEPVAAAFGPSEMHQVRADHTCTGADALSRVCAAGRPR